MTIRFNLRRLLIPIFLVSLQLSHAQPPNGSSSFAFDTSSPLFDLTGDYSFSLPVIQKDGSEVDISLSFPMLQDAMGNLSVDTNNNVNGVMIGNSDPVAGTYEISGQVSRARGASRAAILISIQGWLNDQITPYSLSVATSAEIDPVAGAIVGTSVVHGKVGSGTLRGVTPVDGFDVSLPSGMDGTWTLTLTNVVPTRPLNGAALITLSNGRMLPLHLSGNYSAKRGESKLKLAGFDGAAGIKLNALLPDTEDVIFLTGTALGQKIGVPKDPAQGTRE